MQSLNRLKSERPRKEYDFYETPYGLCKTSLIRLREDENILLDSLQCMLAKVLDAGAGRGVWGSAFNSVFPNTMSVAVELNPITPETIYDKVNFGDFLEMDLFNFTLVYGNPPYSLAEEFVRKSLEIIRDDGYVYFLLRLAFLESKKRHFGLFSEFPPKRVYVLSRRPSFFSTKEGRKTTDALSYAMFLWQKGWEGKTELDWLYWEYDG